MENSEKTDIADDVLLDLTTDIVSAYVGNNSINSHDLSTIISDVYKSLADVAGSSMAPAEAEKPKPAVSIKKSLGHEYLICLEDGKKFKSLKRHLKTHYDLSPDQYREKWGLASDYPMVAPAYAEARSNLAKQMGLGQKRRRNRKST